jgi:hypothetical protein
MSKKENQFVYRPKIEKIEDLQEGDRFLIGEERWEIKGDHAQMTTDGYDLWGPYYTKFLIRAKVPVERDIPCPEGYELRVGDGEWVTPLGYMHWWGGELTEGCWVGYVSNPGTIYAVPLAKPYCAIDVGPDFQPGEKVRVLAEDEYNTPIQGRQA